MVPKDIRHQSLKLVNTTLKGKRVFSDVNKLRVLRLGHYPGLSEWALNSITNVFTRERQREDLTQIGEEKIMWP